VKRAEVNFLIFIQIQAEQEKFRK